MKLSVLYGCDNAYAPYTGISMTSLFENNPQNEITVYLAGMDISQENMNRFSTLVEQYGQSIVFLDTKQAIEQIISMNCGTWNGSLAAWLRFFVLDQIPDTVDRLIWLDSDTIIAGSIAELGAIPFEGNILAAVCDCLSIRERYRLNFLDSDPYFNSGVIIFNMQALRENNTIQKMMTDISENTAIYKIPDQDMMNHYYKGKILKLPPKYNMQCFLKAYSIRDYFSVYHWGADAYYNQEELSEAISAPVIIHFFRFLGDYPWTRGKNLHPAKGLYEEWKNKSLWKDDQGAKPKSEISFKAEKILYQILPRKMFLRLFAWFTNRGLPDCQEDTRHETEIS